MTGEPIKLLAGVILSTQQPPGELLRQVVKLLQTLSADDMKNASAWLQEFRERE